MWEKNISVEIAIRRVNEDKKSTWRKLLEDYDKSNCGSKIKISV